MGGAPSQVVQPVKVSQETATLFFLTRLSLKHYSPIVNTDPDIESWFTPGRRKHFKGLTVLRALCDAHRFVRLTCTKSRVHGSAMNSLLQVREERQSALEERAGGDAITCGCTNDLQYITGQGTLLRHILSWIRTGLRREREIVFHAKIFFFWVWGWLLWNQPELRAWIFKQLGLIHCHKLTAT